MKPKILLCIIGLLGILSSNGMSQAITEAEYYIDSDPGEGNGIQFTLNNSGIEKVYESVSSGFNTSSLSIGNHVLSVRFKNSDGSWSAPVSSVISVNESLTTPNNSVNKVVASEYFIGSDPGEGNGENLTASDGNYNFLFEKSQTDVNTISLLPGTYPVSVRSKNSTGLWSIPVTTVISVNEKLASPSGNYLSELQQAEFYVNADPGAGNASGLSLTKGRVTDSLETSGLSGANSLYIRFKKANNEWSLPVGVVFSVSQSLSISGSNKISEPVKLEYFLQTDPGVGNGTSFGAESSGIKRELRSVSTEINIPPSSNGRLLLGVRAQSEDGEWSSSFLSGINVINPMGDILLDWSDIANRDSVAFHLTQLGYSFDEWDRSSGEISLLGWRTIFWDEPDYLANSERDSLKSFLSVGNNNSLIIGGEDIGGYHEQGRTFSDSTFFRQYLHSRLVYDNGSSSNNPVFGRSIHDGAVDSVRNSGMDVVRPVYGGVSGYAWKSNTVKDSSLTVLFDGNYNVAYSTFQWKNVTYGLGNQIQRTLNWISNSGGSLPVEMTELNSIVEDGKVVLKWRTKSESNNAGWEVEVCSRSSAANSQQNENNNRQAVRQLTDAEAFRKVGFIQGNGTTTEPKDYSFEISTKYFVGEILKIRLKQIDADGNYSYSNEIEITLNRPNEFSLEQNYPNPFNPNTEISYQLSAVSHVSLVVYDLLGREVVALVNEKKEAGKYSVTVDAGHLTSGVYFYRLNASSKSGSKFVSTRKMVLVK